MAMDFKIKYSSSAFKHGETIFHAMKCRSAYIALLK